MKLHNYISNSGKDLIMEYIDSLPMEELVDGLEVMRSMENNEFDKIYFKRWEKRYMKYILENIIAYSM